MRLALSQKFLFFALLIIVSCTARKDEKLRAELKTIDFKKGDIALCGADKTSFGSVDFEITCSELVKENFNLATALLHSFEYDEAEKAFAKVLEQDPQCVMAYWGVAMSNFHTLWAVPGKLDLEKGSKTIAIARTLKEKSAREGDYLEAIGAFYDGWDKIDHDTRVLRFEKAMEHIYLKYPQDKEAAVFYALALGATASPKDKSFSHQRKAGEILNKIFPGERNHPGIAHYIIHTYDYPELASLGLSAATAYAAIAPASAHAQHMPSHIFTRLGIWKESEKSNLNSISSAQCYAATMKMKGHWDEEFHGMDYLAYAYLQEGKDISAKHQVDLLGSFDGPSVSNGKSAYVYGAIPSRFAVERKQWAEAAALPILPEKFPWEKFPWENSLLHFAKLLGYVHTGRIENAKKELVELKSRQAKLIAAGDMFRANQIRIEVNTSEAWILFKSGENKKALELMMSTADMEDASSKPPITPGEIAPARELLGDMLMEMNAPAKALVAYEEDLKRHPNRFNGLSGAGAASLKINDKKKATEYYTQLIALADTSECKRAELTAAKNYLRQQ